MKAIKYISLVFLLIACQGVPSQEYVSWMQDEANGFHQERNMAHLVFDVQYADKSYQKLKDKTEEPIEHLFYIRIAAQGKNGQKHRALLSQVAAQHYSYFSFGMEKDVYVVANEKQYPCRLFHYEQSHGKLGELYFVAGFELADLGIAKGSASAKEEISLVIHPSVLETGPVKFRFDLSSLPELK